jgi:hypothetical protein
MVCKSSSLILSFSKPYDTYFLKVWSIGNEKYWQETGKSQKHMKTIKSQPFPYVFSKSGIFFWIVMKLSRVTLSRFLMSLCMGSFVIESFRWPVEDSFHFYSKIEVAHIELFYKVVFKRHSITKNTFFGCVGLEAVPFINLQWIFHSAG